MCALAPQRVRNKTPATRRVRVARALTCARSRAFCVRRASPARCHLTRHTLLNSDTADGSRTRTRAAAQTPARLGFTQYNNHLIGFFVRYWKYSTGLMGAMGFAATPTPACTHVRSRVRVRRVSIEARECTRPIPNMFLMRIANRKERDKQRECKCNAKMVCEFPAVRIHSKAISPRNLYYASDDNTMTK